MQRTITYIKCYNNSYAEINFLIAFEFCLRAI